MYENSAFVFHIVIRAIMCVWHITRHTYLSECVYFGYLRLLFQMAMLATVLLYMISYVLICKFKKPYHSPASTEGTVFYSNTNLTQSNIVLTKTAARKYSLCMLQLLSATPFCVAVVFVRCIYSRQKFLSSLT